MTGGARLGEEEDHADAVERDIVHAVHARRDDAEGGLRDDLQARFIAHDLVVQRAEHGDPAREPREADVREAAVLGGRAMMRVV